MAYDTALTESVPANSRGLELLLGEKSKIQKNLTPKPRYTLKKYLSGYDHMTIKKYMKDAHQALVTLRRRVPAAGGSSQTRTTTKTTF